MKPTRQQAETIAKRFHDVYVFLAPQHGYETREASAKPWSEVPEQNRSLMISTVFQLLTEGTIKAQSHYDHIRAAHRKEEHG